MIPAPITYGDWIRYLDLLKTGDNDDLMIQALEHGKLEWQTGVAERITRAISDVLDARLKRISDALQREMNHAREEATLVRALSGARHSLAVLIHLANLPALPNDVRATYTGIIAGYVERVQSSLEASAQRDRTGKLLNLLRKNSLTRFPEITSQQPLQPESDQPPGSGGGKRRVILS